MSEPAPHPTPVPGERGPLLLRLFAGLLVVLAGACAMLFVPFALVFAATSDPGEWTPGIAPWMVYLWCLLAFMASIGLVVAGVGALQTPRLGRVCALFCIFLMVFFAFPLFWAPA